MPQQYTRTPVIDLSRGLVTEQTPFNRVENSTLDEINCDILNNGTRVKRKGLIFSDTHMQPNTFSRSPTDNIGSAKQVSVWKNAGGLSGLNVTIVQSGSNLFLLRYDNDMNTWLTGSSVGSTVSLNPFYVRYPLNAGNTSEFDFDFREVDIAYHKEYAIVAGAAINPFFLRLDVASSGVAPFYSVTTIFRQAIDIKERDFERIGDESLYFNRFLGTRPRAYDIYNQGWTEESFNDYRTSAGGTLYPPQTARWYRFLNANGRIDEPKFTSAAKGTTLIEGGKFIISVHYDPDDDNTENRSRRVAFASDQDNHLQGNTFFETDFPTRSVGLSRTKTVESYAGRMWYAGVTSQQKNNRIWFSQIITKEEDFEKCYQQADPTSQFDSEVRDNDGGVIEVSGIAEIIKLKTFNETLLVFATNGVWAIRPRTSDGFRPNNFFVEMVTDVGTLAKKSIVEVESVVYYVAKAGIYAINRDENNNFIATNLTKPSIESYWLENYANSLNTIKSAYDKVSNKVYWLFGEENNALHMGKALVLDLQYGAFMPWTFLEQGNARVYDVMFYDADDENSPASFNDYFFGTRGNQSLPTIMFLCGHGFQVPDGSVINPGGANNEQGLVFSQLRGENATDYFINPNVGPGAGHQFPAFMETTYEFFGDIHNEAVSPDITVYTTRDNIGWWRPFSPWTGNNRHFFRDNDLTVNTAWGFRSFDSDYKSAYKTETALTEFSIPNTTDWVFKTSHSIKNVNTKGQGNGLRLRFEAVPAKNFKLIGYNISGSKNREYDNFR